MTSRVLLVEPSATMRYVLENFLLSLGHGVLAVDDYSTGTDKLKDQFQNYHSDFSAVVLGWPTAPSDTATELAALLEKPDHQELPTIVMSTDMRAETRAWVAGREHTALLPWKEYEGIEQLLLGMLDVPATAVPEATVPKFDNSDINLLVVDDSASIRMALNDLLNLHGYSVSLCADRLEAMRIAKADDFDIAIVDFYLGEDTGDALCRELIQHDDTGDITCTILTSTYSDHIIKRCLRAGAVECMFKNESSELLLARIDAISRLVRQRKQLAAEQARLELLVDTMAGATLVLKGDGTIGYASSQALQILGFEKRQALLGRRADAVLDPEVLQPKPSGKQQSSWRDATEQPIEVLYEQSKIGESDELLIQFSKLPGENTHLDPYAQLSAQDVIARLQLNTAAIPFVERLQSYLSELDELPDLVSLLLIDIVIESSGQVSALSDYPSTKDRMDESLRSVYRREHHVAELKPGRYAFLLRHVGEPQAYLLTRKIMQIVKEFSTDMSGAEFASTGSLLNLNNNAKLSPLRLLDRARQGLQIVEARGLDQALLIDLRRMLPVYPRTTE